jgi:small GTP-binding protein
MTSSESSFRIFVTGSGGIGKDHVILRFLRDTYDADYVPTIQDSFEKAYPLNGKTYLLNIVDSAGQDEMESINNLAIKSADAFILLYSVTSAMSFGELDKYIHQIKEDHPSSKPKIVIGATKCEMEDDRAVTTEQGRTKCRKLGYPFFECSAKQNINIAPMFEACLKLLLGVENDVKVGQNESSEQDDGGCCNVS